MLALKALALPVVALCLASASQDAPTDRCAPPVAVPTTITTPNSTYYSDGEPPQRFAHAPARVLRIAFGPEAIEGLCGEPPCGMIFVGCTRGNQIALPDPFATDPQALAHVFRHELAHVNGWPATHGD